MIKQTYTKLNHTGMMATLFAVVMAVAALLMAGSGPAQAAFPGTNGKIAFYTGGDVWTMNADGTNPTKLTNNYNSESNPAVSPDGSRIAYEFLRGIWMMNSDGSGKRALTDGTATDEDPTWSADGTRIAFARSGDIWAMNVDGSGVTNLTNSPNNQEFDPAWSPQRDKIAYTRIGCDPANFGAACVYSMNTDGTGQTNLTPETSMPQCPNQPGYFHNGASREPAFSPDGSLIAFSGPLICPHTTGRDIWVMTATGGAKTNLTNDNGTNDKRPAFSPDGTRILFESDRESTNLELYTMSAANGSGPQRLTNNGTLDDNPDWGVARPECATTDGAANPNLLGTTSADSITGTPGDDIICGFGGNDIIDGGGGNDIILGDAGNDRLIGASGRDTLNGGTDTDTASFAGSAQAVEASLVSGFALRVGTSPVQGVALVGIENLTGTSLHDTLSGSAGVNLLTGGKGADELLGLGGNDSLNSRDDARNDSLNGGPGTNRCTTDTREVSIRNCS